MGLEKDYQAKLIRRLHIIFPSAIVLKNDPNYLQGFPDITILEGDHWAVLETKRQTHAGRQPNQSYYVETCDNMSFGRFIQPENEEEVLDELQQALGSARRTRLSRGE